MKNRLLLYVALLASTFAGPLGAISADKLNETVITSPHPFGYDLHISLLPSKSVDAELLICMHGMGSSYKVAEILKSNRIIPYHVMGFNFPEYGAVKTGKESTFGTFDEIAPALFVLKKCIVDGGADKVHLYGFSSGGAVIINALAVLNSNRYDTSLQTMGIGEQEKQKILQSVQKGSIILEVPLRSFDEIADVMGGRDMRMLAKRANQNGMNPFLNLDDLEGLALNCFLYFSRHDEALGNRDDKIFIQSLQKVNRKGLNIAMIGKTEGHTAFHSELWAAYRKFLDSRKV